MIWSLALVKLAHLLVPVYWLGGDLGAFYGARFVTDPSRDVAERMLALKMLNAIDMAPRTALLLAFPTGFSLAVAKGWIAAGAAVVAIVWIVALIWLATAWLVHWRHGEAVWRRADGVMRVLAVPALAGGALAGFSGAWALPLFIAAKLMLLAVAIVLGLVVRRVLVPMVPAIGRLSAHAADPQDDAIIARALGQARPAVVLIWMVVLAASLLGIATPV